MTQQLSVKYVYLKAPILPEQSDLNSLYAHFNLQLYYRNAAGIDC